MIVNVFGYAEKLEKSGFTKSQAEASLQVLVEIMNQEFATKEDIRGLSHQLHAEVNSLREEFNSFRKETQTEFESLRKELHSEIGLLRKELHSEIGLLRNELHSEIGSLRNELHSEIGSLRNELHSEISLVRSDLDKLGDKLTIRMGSMMIAGLTIMFGMLQLTINK
jgi:hypothetical protein